ncbi:MAG: META domain-containing protein [Litorimonas sp.]
MALPIILPLALGALVLAGCAKVASDVRKTRPLASLEGSEWGPMETPAKEQFVAFKANGEIRGHGGCNQFFGQYTQEGQKLTIGALASTKKFCADVMDAENRFMKNLQDTRKIEATHLALRLYNAEGEQLMQLRRKDWD